MLRDAASLGDSPSPAAATKFTGESREQIQSWLKASPARVAVIYLLQIQVCKRDKIRRSQ